MSNFNLRLQSFLDYFKQKTMYGAMAAIATPAVVIAGCYMAYKRAKRVYLEKQEKMMARRSMSITDQHGGKLALKRLKDFNQARGDTASLNAAETELRALLAVEPINDFNKLQSAVSKLEMSGKESVAMEILQKELETVRREKKSIEAYEIEMLLVEMLIYKGDCMEALRSDCLSHDHEEISDARQPLNKAIIHVMLDHPEEEAIKCWEKFIEVRDLLQSPLNPEELEERKPKVDKAIADFNQFKNIVKQLKKDINKAHPSTKP